MLEFNRNWSGKEDVKISSIPPSTLPDPSPAVSSAWGILTKPDKLIPPKLPWRRCIRYFPVMIVSPKPLTNGSFTNGRVLKNPFWDRFRAAICLWASIVAVTVSRPVRP